MIAGNGQISPILEMRSGKIQNDNVSGIGAVTTGYYRVLQFALKFVF